MTYVPDMRTQPQESGPGLDTEFDAEPRNDSVEDVKDAVRAALYDAPPVLDAEDQKSFRYWCDYCEKNGLDIEHEVRFFHDLDGKARQDVRWVEEAVRQRLMRPKYTPPPATEAEMNEPEDRAAVRRAIRMAPNYDKHKVVGQELLDLARRNGGLPSFVTNATRLDTAIRTGSPHEIQRAILDASNHYGAWNGHDPKMVEAQSEMKAFERLIPEFDENSPRYDRYLKQRTGYLLEQMAHKIPKDWNAYQMASWALSWAKKGY